MKSPTKTLFAYGAAAVALVLLILIAVQQDALERRLIQQTQAVAGLKDKTEQMGAQLERLAREGVAVSGGNAGGAEYVDPQAKILHPEVENLLVPAPPMPTPGTTDGVYKRGWPFGDPKTLNPMLANAAEVQEQLTTYIDVALAARHIYGDIEKYHGDVAWRVEVTNDNREYTLYLRRGVKWHVPSGVDLDSPRHSWLKGDHEVTAADFVFALDMILSPQVENGSLKNYYEDVESYEAVDDYTLVVRWKRAVFHSRAFTLDLMPMPRFIFAHNEDGTSIPKETLGIRQNQHWFNNKGYVSAGPYRLAKYEPGVRLELERNEDYFGERPGIARIVYPIFTDPNQTVLKLKARELIADRLQRSEYRREILDFEKVPRAQQPNSPFLNGSISCDIIDQPAYRYIGWNTSRPLFEDVRVRKAMTLALNRQGIIKDVFQGMGTIPVGPYPLGSPDHDPEIQPLPFDLDQAARLLDEAGWVDSDKDGLRDKQVAGRQQSFEFSLLIYASRPEFTALANIFKEDLLKIGVKMSVEAAEWSLMQKRMHERDFDAYTGGWAQGTINDPYQLWHSSQADSPEGSNMTGFRNEEADQLMEQLRITFDGAERQRMLRRIHRLIVESFNYAFLASEQRPFCYYKELKGVVYSKVRPPENSLPWWVAQP